MSAHLRTLFVSFKRFFAIVPLVLAVVMAGCSSSSPKISITLSPASPQNANGGQVIAVSATLLHDTKAAGVTWGLTGGGALSGQTTTGVTYTAPATIAAAGTATITATSVTDATVIATLTINLVPISVTLNPSSAQTLDQAKTVSVTATVAADPATKGVTWSLNGGAGTLTNSTTTSVTYNAPATVTTASNPVLTATSISDNTKTATLTINLVPPPSVSTASLATGTVNVAYSATLAAAGGVAPDTWSISAGTLPAGLVLNASTGAITGTPTAFGTSNITAKVTDADGLTATANLSIKILPPPVVITTTSLPNGIVNTPGYSATLASTGGAPPITWSWVAQAGSTLPPGLALVPATGVISGTPTAAGTFNVSVTATDSSTPALTGSKNLSITIIPQLSITTNSPLPSGITSTAYSGTLASTGGINPITWTLATGSNPLPAGLSLSSAGAITGTPTAAGTFTFTAQAADSGTPQQKVTKAFTISIIQQLVITTAPSLPTGSVTTPYSLTFASSGGTGAVTWAVASGSTLPGGLTLTAAGLLSGTPTTANTYHFSITATDSGTPAQTATVAFTLTITPKLAITTASLPSGTLGTAYNTTVLSNNGGIAPISWSWIAQAGSSLPGGLNINSSTGVISGTPTATGTFNITVTATDSSTPTHQTASQNFSISIATAPLSVATTGLPNGVMGQAYTGATLQSAGGNPPVTWSISVGSLPTWANLNASTGAITGTPTATGTTTFTVKATDSSVPTPQTATKQLSITVAAALSITTASLPGGTVGNPYNSTVAATGGTTPYTWSWAAQAGSSLPPGLNINSSTGAISGTPGGQGGTYNVTVSVSDSGAPQQNTSANFSITITVATLTVTTTSGSLPAGTVNTAYPSTQLNASGGIPPYTWTITSGSLPTGMNPLSSSGQISGTPTATGTFNFTVQVTDSATPTAHTATANLSITVNNVVANACAGYGTGNEAALKGSYAILFQGMNDSTTLNPFAAAGSFTADGTGKITAGEVDVNQPVSISGYQHQTVVASGSSYTLGTDNRGCMTLFFGGNNQFVAHFAVGGISAGVASKGRLIEFDSTSGNPNGLGSGILRLQTASDFVSSHLKARYAFGTDGWNSVNGHVAAGGSFSVGGGGTTISNGFLDVDNAGSVSGPISGATGTISSISATTGRATATLNGGAGATFNLAVYVVNANEFFTLTTDTLSASTVIVSGRAIVTGSSFSDSSLNGNYILHLTSSGGGSASVSLGLLNLSGGSLSGNLYQYQGGVASTQAISGGYNVDPTSGRVTVSGTGVGSHPPVLYLPTPTDGISGFLIGTDGAGAFGVVELQPTATYSTTSLGGNGGKFFFSNEDPGDNTIKSEVGTVTVTPSTGAISGTGDSSGPGGNLQTGNSITGTFVINPDGTGNLGPNTVLLTNGTKIFFIDESSNGTTNKPASITVVEQ